MLLLAARLLARRLAVIHRALHVAEKAPDASERESELRIRSRTGLGGNCLRGRKRTSGRVATRRKMFCLGATAEQYAEAGAIGRSA